MFIVAKKSPVLHHTAHIGQSAAICQHTPASMLQNLLYAVIVSCADVHLQSGHNILLLPVCDITSRTVVVPGTGSSVQKYSPDHQLNTNHQHAPHVLHVT